MKKIDAIIVGATGATGQELVKLLLNDSNYRNISVFVRKKINLKHDKLTVHKIDFSKLNDIKDLVVGDVLFSALGTTKKESGNKNKQYLVDFTYQFEFAKMASENGVKDYSLVSSIGADEKSFFFYPRIKGQLEEAIKDLSFKKIQIFQAPSLIRQSELIRAGEKTSLKFLDRINKLGLLKSLKPIHVKHLAKKMIAEVHIKQLNRITVYKPTDISVI
tara:strand:- start:266 stop:919 length:654 start_codon:yes stop_codon:yes gene_type:complete